ncbi:MAG: DUF2809 domain-containing protein [Acidimicrobiales bacterium]
MSHDGVIGIAGKAEVGRTLRPGYLFVAIGLFIVEVCIALFVDDGFVRPYLGDVLAVMLVYASLRAVFGLSIIGAVVASLAIAFAIEFSQLVGLLNLLGLQRITVARVVLGTAFEWLDLVAYVAGAAVVVLVEWLRT